MVKAAINTVRRSKPLSRIVSTYVAQRYTVATVYNSGSTEGLCVITALKAGNWQIFPWNYQQQYF
jgi:hypothetical protein